VIRRNLMRNPRRSANVRSSSRSLGFRRVLVVHLATNAAHDERQIAKASGPTWLSIHSVPANPRRKT